MFVRMRPVWTLKMEIDLVLKLQRNCILLPLQAMTNPCRPGVASFKSPARSTAALALASSSAAGPRPRVPWCSLYWPQFNRRSRGWTCGSRVLSDGARVSVSAVYCTPAPALYTALYTVHTWRSAWLRARAVDTWCPAWSLTRPLILHQSPDWRR